MINICLVGCGGMAATYRHKYTQIPGARLVLLIDIDEQTAKNAARELEVERCSTRFEDALADDIHIVDISTPNHLHAEQAEAALRAGKHILLQKPIAPNVKEALAIVAAARASGKQAGMFMSLLDNPVYHDMKQIIQLGLLGKITAVHSRGAHNGGLSLTSDSWRKSLDKTGGGSFIQLESHHINLLQWMLESPIIRVASFSKNVMCPDLEGDDTTAAICEYANGVAGTLESSYCSENSWLISVYGSQGFIHVTNDFRLELKLNQPFAGTTIIYDQPDRVKTLAYDFDYNTLKNSDNIYDQHAAFVKAIKGGSPVPVTVESGLQDLKVVKAVYKSAAEKRFVDISEID